MLHEVYTWTKTSLGVEYIDVIFAFTLESQSRPCIGPSKRGRTKADMLPLGPCPVYASQAGRLWNSELSGYRLTRIFFDLTKLGRQPFLHSSCCSLAPFTFHEHHRTALSFRYFSGSVLIVESILRGQILAENPQSLAHFGRWPTINNTNSMRTPEFLGVLPLEPK